MGIRNASFGAAANDAKTVQGQQVDLVVGGTFVGTVELQVCIPGAAGAELWVKVDSLTAPGTISYQAGTQRNFRAACTAYTSGTAYYSVAGLTLEDHIW